MLGLNLAPTSSSAACTSLMEAGVSTCAGRGSDSVCHEMARLLSLREGALRARPTYDSKLVGKQVGSGRVLGGVACRSLPCNKRTLPLRMSAVLASSPYRLAFLARACR